MTKRKFNKIIKKDDKELEKLINTVLAKQDKETINFLLEDRFIKIDESGRPVIIWLDIINFQYVMSICNKEFKKHWFKEVEKEVKSSKRFLKHKKLENKKRTKWKK